MKQDKDIAVALTGASGARYGLRLIECLVRAGHKVHVLYSKAAQIVLKMEVDLQLPGQAAEAQRMLTDYFDAAPEQIRVYGRQQWTAPIASGSNPADALVICPCTMGTLASIAHGIPTPPAIDLINNNCFYMTAPIDEVDAARIKVGQPARISLDAFADKSFDGQVRRIGSYVLDKEKQARTVEVEMVFSNPEDTNALLAGYSADVEIIQQAKPGVLRIPSNAIIDEQYVYVLSPIEERLLKRTVKSGLSNWD